MKQTKEEKEKEKAEQIAATLRMYSDIKTAQPVTLDQVAPKDPINIGTRAYLGDIYKKDEE